MLAKVRLRLTVLFVLITTFVYLVTSACGILRFWMRINATLDDEITSLAAESLPLVKMAGGTASLDPLLLRPHVSLQVYSRAGKLLKTIGIEGVPRLNPAEHELKTVQGKAFRSRVFPLSEKKGSEAGFLQVQVSTRERDIAIGNYLELLLFIAPLLLIGLSFAGASFAGWAVRPIEQSLSTLRRFLADAGHELGTPLAILRSTFDNLSLELSGQPAAEEKIEIVTRTTERMGKLVADMSQLASLENAELSVPKVPLRLDVLLNETVSGFTDLLAESELSLTLTASEDVWVKGDRGTLECVIANLLQNAIRYTDRGGKINVTLSTRDNTAMLRVADTGIGISAEALAHIFERFYRVDKSRTRAAGGSGLGLSIVKAAVDFHEGSVSVKSAEGDGSEFLIAIPLCARAVKNCASA